MKVFYFTKIDSAEEVMDCGIKTEPVFREEITVNEFKKDFFSRICIPPTAQSFMMIPTRP